ncbi:PilN domain-containing protein [Neptunomonas sp. XY-337]|uniref:PilN domain-containing protein n=1 Tax=Neptunomonas sp. XY-337 TaxID=2561897 RepID=UPI0010AB157D|nr:PilN domain-containing protein [Neptunomonas sp. XY-337]
MKQRVNLLPPRPKVVKQQFTFKQMLSFAAVILVASGAMAAWLHFETATKDNELRVYADTERKQSETLNRLESLLAEQVPDPVLVARRDRLTGMLTQQAKLADLLEQVEVAQRSGFSRDMRMLSEQVPNKLWFTEFSITGPGQALILEGVAQNADLVPLLVKSLSTAEHFGALYFSSLETTRDDDGLYTFTIAGQRVGGERD